MSGYFNRLRRGRSASLPTVIGDDLKIVVDGQPVWLASLPANLREVKRGLEQGLFGPPVPIQTRGPAAQRWANAALHISTVEDAIRAVDVLIAALGAERQEEG